MIFFIALALAGAVTGGFFVSDYARARASQSWPGIDGVVLSRNEMPGAKLRYAYSFDGRSYSSARQRLFFGRFYGAPPSEVAPGQTVTVFVDPKHPSFSILKTGGSGAAFVFFSFLSGACIFLGVGGVVWTLSAGVENTNLLKQDEVYQ